MLRTHDAFLPRPDIGPSLQKVFHNEHIGDDALIVPKRQTTNRGGQCTSERVLVSQQSGDSRWPIAIGVRERVLGGRSRIRSCRGKVQTSTVRNRPDVRKFFRIVTRRMRDAAFQIFSTERSVILRPGIVAHNCGRKSKLSRDRVCEILG